MSQPDFGGIYNLALDVVALYGARSTVHEAESALDPAPVRHSTLEPVAWGEEFANTSWLTVAYTTAQEAMVQELHALQRDLVQFAEALKECARLYEETDAGVASGFKGWEQLLVAPLTAPAQTNANQASVEAITGAGDTEIADQTGQPSASADGQED